ncbi:hypothetical protein [Vibrio sp. H11]|uniref:hypothetical protein n=1 Tax=Vibrio sp. H11 TaxID=2565928 RepID=UPI0010A61838|nr:hypothetical protein [Vibrio sp. H11]
MKMLIPDLLQKYQEWKGRLIAYVGGSGVSLFSNNVAANAKQIAESTVHNPDVTLANLVSLGGLVVIFARLVFDIYVHFDGKRRKPKENLK